MKPFFVLLLIAFTGCATYNPAQVPELPADAVPALHIPQLSPPEVALTVENTRQSNVQAGNAEQIVEIVRNAMLNSLVKGGIQVAVNAKNKLHLQIEDCRETDANVACIGMTLGLHTPRYELSVSGYSSNGMSRNGGSAIPGMGNIDKAYQSSLSMVIEELPPRLEKFLKR